jgi:mannose-6-phosphate isomerase
VKPYKTNPVIVERVWGGGKLAEYNKDIGENIIGESWETGLIGGNIPVLIKLIDAKEPLSVQVHPDDEFALKVENTKNGKSEAWVILECEEGASIIYGFNRSVKKGELKSLLGEGRLSEILNCVEVRKGDCIYIPAGTVHSLGRGILAYEVQQPSDLTYRISDWNRTDLQGNRRELHIEKALGAIDYSAKLPEINNMYDALKDNYFKIVECDYFKSCFRRIADKEGHNYWNESFEAITVIAGYAVLRFEDSQMVLHKGDTCIIPKGYDEVVRLEGFEAAEYIVTTCGI